MVAAADKAEIAVPCSVDIQNTFFKDVASSIQ